MLLLNELEAYRKKVTQGELTNSDVKLFAESIASFDDIATLLGIVSGRFASRSQSPDEAAWSAFFQAGLSGFGNEARGILRRSDTMGLLLGMGTPMKGCVLECNDSTAWRFLSAGAAKEAEIGSDAYATCTDAIKELRRDLTSERIAALECGTARIADHLLVRFHKSPLQEKARVLWQLKQHMTKSEVIDTYASAIVDLEPLRWLSLQCLVFFQTGEVDYEMYSNLAYRLIKNPPQNVLDRVALTQESIANVLAFCAVRTSSAWSLEKIRKVVVLDRGRLRSLQDWCRLQIDRSA